MMLLLVVFLACVAPALSQQVNVWTSTLASSSPIPDRSFAVVDTLNIEPWCGSTLFARAVHHATQGAVSLRLWRL